MDDAQNQPEAQTQARQQRRLPDFDTLRASRRARILLLLTGFFLAAGVAWGIWWAFPSLWSCLLYTSEAADD